MFSPVGVKQKSPPARLSLAGAKPHRAGGGDGLLGNQIIAVFVALDTIRFAVVKWRAVVTTQVPAVNSLDDFAAIFVGADAVDRCQFAGDFVSQFHFKFSLGVRGPGVGFL